MTSTSAEAQSTSLRLAEWMKETMKLSSTKNVDVKQLSASFMPFCKGSSMIAFWNGMIKHVRPAEEVEFVKKNLELSNLRTQREHLAAQLEQKKRTLRALKDEDDSLALQVRNQKVQAQFLNQQVKMLRDGKKKIQIRSQIHKSYAELLEEQISSCRAYLEWITELKDTYKRNRERNAQPSKATLESALQILQEAINCDKSDRKNLFPIVGDLVKNYSPKTIVLALNVLSREFVKTIQHDVETFDVENELAELDVKIRKNSGPYGSFGATALSGMLMKWNIDCIKRYSEQMENELKYNDKMKIAMTARENIVEQLKCQFEFEPAALQLVIDHLDAEAEIAGAQACLECFQSAKAYLREEIEEKSKTQKDVTVLKEKIVACAKIIREDQEKIIDLARKNSSVTDNLQEHQQNVQRTSETAVCSHLSDVTRACTNAQSVFHAHLSALNRADMDKLHQVETTEGLCSTKDLTIHRYYDVSEEKGTFSYQKSLCHLAVHGHVPPSVALQKIFEMKSKISRLQTLHSLVDEMETGKTLEQLQKMHQKCMESERRLFERLDPQYKIGVQVADDAKEHCTELEESIKVWYDQPAQYQVPWLTLHGLTLEAWNAKNRVT